MTTIAGNLEKAVGASPRIPVSAKPQLQERLRLQASGLAFGAGDLFDRLPPGAREEMIEARRAATVDGNRKALLYGAGFVLLGLLVSTRLPLRAQEHPQAVPRR